MPKTVTKQTALDRAKARLERYETLGRAYDTVANTDQEFDNPTFVKKHPWVSDIVEGLRFLKTVNFAAILDDHLNVMVSIPDDLDDLSLWGDDITNLMTAVADSIRRLEERQQVIVQEARRRGTTWRAIGDALGTTRQSAWGRYSEEE